MQCTHIPYRRQVLMRASRLQANGSFLRPQAFQARKEYLVAKDTGALHEQVRIPCTKTTLPCFATTTIIITYSILSLCLTELAGRGEPDGEPGGHDGDGEGPSVLRHDADGHGPGAVVCGWCMGIHLAEGIVVGALDSKQGSIEGGETHLLSS